MKLEVIRVLRTPHSERYLLQNEGRDAAAVDFHYLTNGKVSGTLIVFDGGGFTEKDVPTLLTKIDEVLLPEVRIEDRNLSFTVVMGKVIGNFMPEGERK